MILSKETDKLYEEIVRHLDKENVPLYIHRIDDSIHVITKVEYGSSLKVFLKETNKWTEINPLKDCIFNNLEKKPSLKKKKIGNHKKKKKPLFNGKIGENRVWL